MRTMLALLMVMALVLASGAPAVFGQGPGRTTGESNPQGLERTPGGAVPSGPTRTPGEMTPISPQRGGDRPMSDMPIKREGQAMAVPRASEIIGLAVTNEQHHDLGKVEDLLLSSDGRISHLIVSKGGVLGFGGKLIAIPWQAFNPKIHERALVVNLSQERFEGAPTFSNWAELKEGGYESRVRAYYGEGPGLEGQNERHGFESSPETPPERTPGSSTLPGESSGP